MGDTVRGEPESRLESPENNQVEATEATAGSSDASRRRIIKAALSAAPLILTLKSGPARALTASDMMSPGHMSHA